MMRKPLGIYFCQYKNHTDFLFLLIFFLGLPFQNIWSQKKIERELSDIQTYNSIKFTQIEKELSGQYISCILQGKEGFLWIGTQDGLYRFDGNNTKAYRYNPIKESLPGTWARVISQDESGVFWLGINGIGLTNFDSQENKFKTFSSELNSPNEYNGLIVLQILSSKNGNIWIQTEHGVFRKNKSNQNFKKITTSSPTIIISETANGKILIAKDHKLFYYNENTNKLIPQLNNVSIEQLEPTVDSQIIYKSKGNLYKYNLENNDSKQLEIPEQITLFSNHQKNIIYFLGKNQLYKFNTLTENFQAFNLNNSNLKINDIKTLFVDAEGVLWVGSRKGLYKENITRGVFKESIPLHARAIIADSTHVYIGGRKGFYQYSKANKTLTQLIKNTYILSVYRSSAGFWLGDINGNIHFMDNKGNTKIFDAIIKKEDSPILEIYGITEDTNGYIWIGSWIGLHLINKKGELIETYSLKTDDENKALNVAKLFIDKKETLWITTVGNGIYKIPMISKISSRIKKFDYKRYVHKKGDTSAINSNVLYEIIEEKDGTIWFGANYGINRYIEETDSFESLKKDGKLFDYNVMSLKIDKNNLLWISTIRNGLFIYDQTKNQYFNLNQDDGLISNGCLFNSSYSYKDRLYFGTEDGVQVINPKNLVYPTIDKSPLITSLNVYGDVETSSASTLNNKKIKLKHNQSNFAIRFQLLDFRFSDKVNYFYKIKEIQEDWRKTKENTASFTNIQPGEYHFLLKATYQSQLTKASPESSMIIIITPPWHKTWWAYIIYAVLLTTIGYRLYRFQLSRKLAVAESKQLKEVNKLKSSLYTNITHEFRTPLTVILGMADALKTNAEKKEFKPAEKPLKMIKRSGKKLLRLVNEMLDLAKLESGNMEMHLVQTDVIPFVKYLSESFHSLAEERKINLTVYSEIDALEMDFDVDKLASIISNLLSNAIKFTSENGKIIVHLNKIQQQGNGFFTIKIKDNGLGVSEEELPNIFDRFYQANTSTSQLEGGTGIGLALVKELVELMNGTISVESALKKGSIFAIQIPITNNAVKTTAVKTTLETPVAIASEPSKTEQPAPDDGDELPLALIIEDNQDVAHYLRTCLKGKYQTVHAINGIIGIEMAYEKIPDIIISDVMMPGKDGFEVCQTLKTDERTDHIPIILLTAKVTMKDRLTGLSHGADAYLAKPFVKEELFTRLDQLIALRDKMLKKIAIRGFGQLITSKEDSPETKFIKKVVNIISEEMHRSTFGPVQLAQKLSLSESQIYRKLKAITNISTAIYIRSFRLQKAKEMLKTTSKTVSEIAYDVGFNDPSWFSRAFKEEFGSAPNDIRK